MGETFDTILYPISTVPWASQALNKYWLVFVTDTLEIVRGKSHNDKLKCSTLLPLLAEKETESFLSKIKK